MINGIGPDAPSLRDLQQLMASCLLAASPDADARLAPWLALPAGARARERLAVYAGGYPARLHEALAEQFPALAHLAGARRFGALVSRYIAAARLPSYSLNQAGAELPAFLARDELTLALPFAAELARLEWAVVIAFHAAQAPPPAPDALVGWDLDRWRLAVVRFQPAVALLESAWPLQALWAARELPIEAIDLDLRRGERVLVRRAGYGVACEAIDAAQATALARLLAGEALGEVSAVLTAGGAAPQAVGAWFAAWMAAGMIARIEG